MWSHLMKLTVLVVFVAGTGAVTPPPDCCTDCPQFCNPDGTETDGDGKFITNQLPPPLFLCACNCKPNWENSVPTNPICDQFIPCKPENNPPPCDPTGGTLGPNEDQTACVCNCNPGFGGPDCSVSCLPPSGNCVGLFGIWACLKSSDNYLDLDSTDLCPAKKWCCRPKRECDQAGESCKTKRKCRKNGGTPQRGTLCPGRKVCCLIPA